MANLIDIRHQQSSMSDEDFIAWANEIVYKPLTYFVSYRTIRYQIGLISGAAVAKTKTEAIMTFIQKVDILAHQMLSIPGDENGSGGGIDISLSDAQYMINVMVQQNIINQLEADVIINLGRTSNYRYQDWGLTSFSQSNLEMISPVIEGYTALSNSLLNQNLNISRAPDGFDIFDTVNNIHLHYPELPTLDKIMSDRTGVNNG